jgi:predicted DNA-binding transcriptional regulator YafY
MGQKSSVYRTILILKTLNQGKKLCVTRLAEEYEVSSRTIRRDFELIRSIFGDFVSKDGECYQAYQTLLLDDVLHATDLMTLANIVNLFGITDKKSLISHKTEALINKSMSVYDFKSRPFERVQKSKILKKLEHAIKFHKEIKIFYKTERAVNQSKFYPYKILFLNENFYLVGENASKAQFEYRRISLIEEAIYTQKVFTIDKEIEKFIQSIQTPWAVFGKEEIIVKVRVLKKVRRFFIFKKYLPSQEVVHTFENGDIEVHYKISSLFEIEDLFIKWLPHLKIISPQGFKKMLKRRLKQKLASLT